MSDHPSLSSPARATPQTSLTPITRLPGLDVVRGVAIIGTLASNIWLFTAFDGDRIIDIWWRDVLGWLPNGKFLGLLTIVFGIGLEIQRQAARRHGRRWPGTYPVRAALLFLDGVLNYVLVVQFDVLRSYAIVGFIVAFVLLLPEKKQWIVIGTALAAHLSLLAVGRFTPGVFTNMPTVLLGGEPPFFETRPTYWQTVESNLHTVFADLNLGSDAGSIITLGLVSFTLGALLYRRGVFEARGARVRRWLMTIGLGVGVPLDIATFLTGEHDLFGRYATATLVAFGLLGALAEWSHRRGVGILGRQLSAVGRVALSCYVLQNILGRTAQALIGRSPFSHMVDPIIGTLVLFVVISALLVVFARVWLKTFRKGPLELIWDASFRGLTDLGRGVSSTPTGERR